MTATDLQPSKAPGPEGSPPPDHNRLGFDFRKPMPRPKVRGWVIDAHTHLLAARHARDWFEAADHYGIDAFVTMSPLEGALDRQQNYGDRHHSITLPKGGEQS